MDISKQIEEMVEQRAREMVRGLLSSLDGHAAKAVPKRKAIVRKVARRNVPASCVKPGCKNPATGPRFSYLCAEHRDKAIKADKKKWLEAWKAENG